jgi:hypothetical protein
MTADGSVQFVIGVGSEKPTETSNSKIKNEYFIDLDWNYINKRIGVLENG